MKSKDMIAKYMFSGLLGLSLLFTSCKQDDVLSTATVKQDDYITLELGLEGGGAISASEEGMRTLIYEGAGNKPTIFFGKDGDEVMVHTSIYKRLANNKATSVFSRNLPWTVANNGTRLIYKGGLTILRAFLQDAKTYHIIAMPINSANSTYKIGLSQITHATKINPIQYSIPIILQTELVRKGKEGRLLVNKDINNSKFVPRGHLMLVSVTNNLSETITMNLVRHNYSGLVATDVTIQFPQGEVEELSPTFSYSEARTGFWNSTGTRRRYYDAPFPNVPVAPGTTERFISFYPDFFYYPDPRLRFQTTSTTHTSKLKAYSDPAPVAFNAKERGALLRYDLEFAP